MKKSSYKVAVYLLGGGLLLTWLEPQDGVLKFFLIGGLILAFGTLDGFLAKRAAAQKDSRVVSIRAFQAKRTSRTDGSTGHRERRTPRPVYGSNHFSDVDTLLEMLRAEGMNPMMVTQNRKGTENSTFYMVMLPEPDAERARPLIEMYELKSAKRPS